MPNAPAIPVPDDVTGPAYQAAYRKGWAAREAGVGRSHNPWLVSATRRGRPAQPDRSYAALWLRGYNDCGRARLRSLRGRPVGV